MILRGNWDFGFNDVKNEEYHFQMASNESGTHIVRSLTRVSPDHVQMDHGEPV